MEGTLGFRPWVDLPEPLAELVLERLPLVDYVHFAAVCPKWRSIQRGHRLRHAPQPPPMANQLPWLVSSWLSPNQELGFYNPWDKKSFGLCIPSSLHNSHCLASCRGWLLLLDVINFDPMPTSRQPFLFNPITAALITLPLLSLIPRCSVVGAMSTTPTDPDCVVLIVFGGRAFLYQPNDPYAIGWTITQLTERPPLGGGSAVYCGDKFYYLYGPGFELHVIDPFVQEDVSRLGMKCPYGPFDDPGRVFLQEIGGELFSVQPMYWSVGIKPFRVFKAELSRQEWVMVETLGDHVLLLGLLGHGDCSVLADDVGFKRNSIYALKETCYDENGHIVSIWGVFDLGTGGWTEEVSLTNGSLGAWILPTLDSLCPAKASD